MVVGARQSFHFFRQIIWFLGNNRAFTKFRYQILHNLISIIKLEKNKSLKANLKLTTRVTLNKNKKISPPPDLLKKSATKTETDFKARGVTPQSQGQIYRQAKKIGSSIT